MYPSIINVRPLPEYQLEIEFDTAETKVFDMKPYLEIGMLQDLKNESVFKTVHVSFDTIEWETGIDFDPEVLYSESVTKIRDKPGSVAK